MSFWYLHREGMGGEGRGWEEVEGRGWEEVEGRGGDVRGGEGMRGG